IKLKAALAQDPKNIPARLLSARIYTDLGQGDAALGLLMRAQQDGVDELELAKPRTEAAFVAQHYADVVRNTANPPDGLSDAVRASLLAYRGAALGALGRAADAQSALDQALALDPHSLDARIVLARRALERGDPDVARRELAEATREVSKDRRLAPLQGNIAYAAREYPKAEQFFQQTLDAEPWNDLVRGQLAAVQVAEDKLSEAIANLDTVLEDPKLGDVPKQPILNYIRGLAAFRQKDYGLAQSCSEEVVKRVPDYEPARLIA